MNRLEKFKKGLLKTNKTIKKVLVELYGEKCDICNQGCMWNGYFLSLQVDHIDGDNSNNSPNNLRLLCPNCHSQTDSFCGANIKRARAFKTYNSSAKTK